MAPKGSELDDENTGDEIKQQKLSKNQKKRQKKKLQKVYKNKESVYIGKPSSKTEKKEKRPPKQKRKGQRTKRRNSDSEGSDEDGNNAVNDLAVEIEYVSVREIDEEAVQAAQAAGHEIDPTLAEFSRIFQQFASAEELCGKGADNEEEEEEEGVAPRREPSSGKSRNVAEPEDPMAVNLMDDEKKEGGDKPRLSRKQRKRLNRLSVAELKQLVHRPDVVEAHDVTAADPRLLVFLKAYRGTVPVPRHWCHKRKYLQGKRGIEKRPFELPEFIAQTGIEKIRNAIEELDSLKRSKQKQRERVNPKMGKIDIDYQVLHDAFFKWQTKPKLSWHGDIYYEGKEFEIKLKEKLPGNLSAELKNALGMASELVPPPWLINMQRYGPPPSYPNLKVPGLNAPIPHGASFGYHPGGWGKPPVDETGKPLYGDVFGNSGEYYGMHSTEPIDKSRWGELEEEDSEEEVVEEEEELEDDASGIETPLDDVTGLSSVTSGLETPDAIDLRKRAGLDTPETPLSAVPRDLYKVVEQKETGIGGGLFGSDKKYVIPGMGPNEIQVALNPDQLEEQLGDEDVLKEKYELEMESLRNDREDVSDIMADEARKRKRKLEKQKGDKSKKYKDFKF